MYSNKDKIRILHVQNNIAQDASLIGEAFDLFSSNIRRFAFKMIGDHAAAEDIVSQTFLRLMLYREQFDRNQTKFTTWLHHIARMECYKWFKYEQRIDRSDEIKLHLTGEETMSVYRRYAKMDSNQHFQVKDMLAREADVRLDKLDMGLYKIKKQKDKYPVLNAIVAANGDIRFKDLSERTGMTIKYLSYQRDVERSKLQGSRYQDRKNKTPVLCHECGGSFVGRPNKKFCTTLCKNQHNTKKRKAQ